MKAATYPDYGSPDVIEITDLPTPKPNAGEVLLRVEYAAINPIDWKVGAGKLSTVFDCTFPLVVGRDVVGTIHALGENIDQYETGEKVCAFLPRPGGGLAEYVAIPSELIARIPLGIEPAQCAALPLVSVTCWQALVEHADLQPGQRIFILSGAGGTGSIGIQIAKHIGATVITTCSPGNSSYVESLGADFIFDYHQNPIEAIRSQFSEGIDVVYSNVLGELHAKSYELLSKGGKLVTIGEGLCPELGKEFGVQEFDMVAAPNGEHLKKLMELVNNGKIIPPSITIYPIDHCQKAVETNMTGHTKGKIVVSIAI